MLHWKQKAQWTALSFEALIVFSSFLFSVMLTLLSSVLSSICSSVHPGAEIPLVSSFLSSCATREDGAPRQTPAAAERPEQNERERERRERRGQTNLLRKRQFGDVQMYYKMEETAVTHGSYSDFPMEAKIHKLMLIEQPTYAMCTFYAWRVYIY